MMSIWPVPPTLAQERILSPGRTRSTRSTDLLLLTRNNPFSVPSVSSVVNTIRWTAWICDGSGACTPRPLERLSVEVSHAKRTRCRARGGGGGGMSGRADDAGDDGVPACAATGG